MRTYLSTNPHQRGNLAPEELDLLECIVEREKWDASSSTI